MNRNKILIKSFIIYLIMMNNALSVELRRGFNELGETTVNIVGNSGTSFSKGDWDGLAFNVSKTNSSTQCRSLNQEIPLTTIDGYTGYEFKTGFLFVLYSGTLSGFRGFSGKGSTNYSYSFNSNGILSPATDTESAWCADPRKNNNYGLIDLSAPEGNTIGSVKSGIYVSSTVQSGASATLPSLYINRGQPKNIGQAGPQITGTGITYSINDMKCSISPPSLINFGEVNVVQTTNEVALAYESGNLNIQCDGNGLKKSASISVTGDIGRYTNTLKMKMKNSNDKAPAEIRGFIGPNIENKTVCDHNDKYPGWIQFDQTKNQVISIGNLSSGSNQIPYNFTLCSNGIKTSGEADALATINLTWN
ncbi:hypothetical protein [Moellerella wisconsensis]|uniref:hypothetical protein n=1 Tax=Moellerella wisconsensis TaxID=158849 RepID=UPI0030760B13